MEYEFTTYTPGLLGQIAALRFEQWLEDPRLVTAYITWKYQQNPYSDKMGLYVALADGKVVATRGMYGGVLSCGGDLFPIATATDNLVAPAHQGRGLSNRLTRFGLDNLAQQGVDYVLSTSANRTTQLLSRRSGWERVCAYRPLYYGAVGNTPPETQSRRSGIRRVVRNSRFYPGLRTAWAHLRRLRQRAAGSDQPAFQRFDTWVSSASNRSGAVIELAPRPEQMADLVRRQEKNDTRIRLPRDERYYAWRFSEPHSAYRFMFAEASGSDLSSFLVLQQSHGRGEVAVVDWQYTEERDWLDMLREVVEGGSLSTLSIWSATLPATLLAGLESLGFRAGPEVDTRTHPARALLVTSTRRGSSPAEWVLNGRPLPQEEQWDLRMIFSDQY